jgi:hypothetical protein
LKYLFQQQLFFSSSSKVNKTTAIDSRLQSTRALPDVLVHYQWMLGNSNEILAFGPGADSWVNTVMSAGSTWYNYGTPCPPRTQLLLGSGLGNGLQQKKTDRASRPSFLTVLGQLVVGHGSMAVKK